MAWILDLIFFVVLFLGTLIGAKVGFIRGECKTAGWVLSFVIPFIFCFAFKDALESWFGLESSISNGIGNATLGGWITVVISYIILFVIVKLGTWLIGMAGGALADSVKAVSVVNHFLGAILGLLEAAALILFLLLICTWIPASGLHAFINDSTVVGAIFRSDLMALLPGIGG